MEDARDMRARKEEASERVFWSGRKRSSAAATKYRSLTSPTVVYAPRTTAQQAVMALGRRRQDCRHRDCSLAHRRTSSGVRWWLRSLAVGGQVWEIGGRSTRRTRGGDVRGWRGFLRTPSRGRHRNTIWSRRVGQYRPRSTSRARAADVPHAAPLYTDRTANARHTVTDYTISARRMYIDKTTHAATIGFRGDTCSVRVSTNSLCLIIFYNWRSKSDKTCGGKRSGTSVRIRESCRRAVVSRLGP